MECIDTNTSMDSDMGSQDCDPVLTKNTQSIQCASSTCQNHERYCADLNFYRFPKDRARCRLWVEKCGNSNLLNKQPEELNVDYYLCALHFGPFQYQQGADEHRLLPDAVPTIFPHKKRTYSEIDHDYLSTPIPTSCTDSSPSVSSMQTAVPNTVSPCVNNISSFTTKTFIAKPSKASVPSNGSVSVAGATSKRSAAQKKSLVAKRPAQVKETPLQKYMLLCSELKSDLRSLQKHREEGEKLSSNVLDLLLRQAELLPFEDAIFLTGALVNFQEDRYRQTARNVVESATKVIWQEQLLHGTAKVRKQPAAEVAVFIMNKELPGHIIIGKRKITVGGGLYQVPCGEIEFGETWEEAAFREVLESTSLHIKEISVCSIVDTVENSADYHSVTVFMRGFVNSIRGVEPQALQSCRCDSWHWRKWTDMPPADCLFWSLRDYTLENLQPFD
ncbi:uncharacterized protein LOC135397543 [Ornithodoros turicata]